MQSQSKAGGDRYSPPRNENGCAVVTTAAYAGVTFHLFQAVRHVPQGSELNETWVVVSLDRGLTLADLEFNKRRSYTESEIRDAEFTPQYAGDGTPQFAY